MPKAKTPPRPVPPVSAKDAQALVARLDEITARFEGNFDDLEAAIGMYMVGRLVGWKVLVLLHNKRTIQKYEKALGNINIREEFEAEGPFVDKSLAYNIVKKLGNFWKGVNGEYDNPELREQRRNLAL
jgi:hypothetical protein